MPDRGLRTSADRLDALFVWDAEGSPPAGTGRPILWRGFANGIDPDVISVPKLVEANAEVLRARYLAWIYELGETRILGRRLVEHLELRPGFSYWWMTLFAEKCNYSKSPQIDDVIRLMALESWASGQAGRHLIMATSNAPLARCVFSLCARLGLSFEWRRMPTAEQLTWPRRLYQSLPHWWRALAWFTQYLIHRWPLRGVGHKEWRQTQAPTTFFSYLFNLVPDAASVGRFESRYWGHLPEDLHRDGCKTNWLHLYITNTLLPNAKAAANAIRQFNKTGQGRQTHITLDAFLGLSVVIRVLRDWVRLNRIGRRLQQAHFSQRGAMIDLWPLFENDWYRSFYGSEAIINLLNYNLLELALRALPQQRIGVYLQENQGWEFALIHVWKAAGHGHLIGTPHSTVRYWDLRYFFDPRSYRRTGVGDLPMPDQVALNGMAARDAYLAGGYPAEGMVEVEALRYLYLATFVRADDSISALTEVPLRVLVLGDILFSNTHLQMTLLENAAPALPPDTIFTVKPHPACPVRPADYPGLRITVTTDSVSSLLVECDVAYTSSVTSAAADAFCAGVPVVSVLDPHILNMSPLRGRAGAFFASNQQELASMLVFAASTQRSVRGKQGFFTLDPELPRWRKLLLKSIG